MGEYKPAENGIVHPDEYPPTADMLYSVAKSSRIDSWNLHGESYLLGYIDCAYTAMLANGAPLKEAAAWMAQAVIAASKGSFERHLEIGKLEAMIDGE